MRSTLLISDMSQLTNAIRSNRRTSSSPSANNKSQSSSSASSTSSSSFASTMKLKTPNRHVNASLSDDNILSIFSRSSQSKYIAEQRTKAREIVVALQRKNIKLVAIDFDNTFLSIHTSGFYQGTVDNLLEYVRITFYYFIQEILDSPAFGQTLHLCIVSFSSQEQLIRKLLQLAFKVS